MRVTETAFFYKSDMYNCIAAGLFLSPVINSWLFILPTIEQKLNLTDADSLNTKI